MTQIFPGLWISLELLQLDVDVTNNYSKETGKTYTNFKIFSFETQAEINSGGSGNSGYSTEPQKSVDSGEIDDSQLPF